jgi:hypothetical protein
MSNHNDCSARRRRACRTHKTTHLIFAASPSALHDDQILSFAEWCRLNGISTRNGRRLLKGPDALEIVRLSPRRIGITIAANRRWQDQRTRKSTLRQARLAD